MIEQRIFFYWEGPRMPSIYRNSIDYIAAMHPEYEVQVAGPELARPTLRKLAPDLDAVFDRILIPSVKSDIMRMALLHQFGGWYIDCDSRPRIGVTFWDSEHTRLLLNCANVNNKISLMTAFMGGAQHHPFFARALELMGRVIPRRMTHYNVYRSSGPDICLYAATPFLHEPDTRYVEMDYRHIDVIMGKPKGSWTFQEACGIWADDEHPVRFNSQATVGRIDSLEALAFYRTTFARFPQTEAENWRKLMLLAGVQYVQKHGIGAEILDLFIRHVPRSETAAWEALAAQLRETGATASADTLARHLATAA